MTRSTHCAALVIAAIFTLCLTSTVHAVVPGKLSYQGYLTDPIGSPVDADVNITFRLYTVETGGTPLWTGTQLVAVASGLFSVELGGPSAPLPPGAFDTPVWLGIEVESDGEMLPRRPLTTVGFAFVADDALTLTGQSAAALDQSFHVTDMANPHGVTTGQTGAATPADIANLQTQLDAALAAIAALEGADFQAQIVALDSDVTALQGDLANETTNRIADVDAEEAARIAADAVHDTSIATIQSNSVLQLNGLLALSGNTALFNGVNVQVVSGSGTTDGALNGLGNLIVGYNAPRTSGSNKSGSHNLIVGDNHNYASYGGLVAGAENTVSGANASVSGGFQNTASGNQSMVTAGRSNEASAFASSVSGGYNNKAMGNYSAVAGGGGGGSPADGNTAFADYSAILGGAKNVAGDPALVDHAIGIRSVVSGGFENNSSGNHASVLGGQHNVSSGFAATVVGGGGSLADEGNEAFANYSAILGGAENLTGNPVMVDHQLGAQATVSGGQGNNARGLYSSVSGGFDNTAFGHQASVSGGAGNNADGTFASVTGGRDNLALSDGSAVSGGNSRGAIGPDDWVAGSLWEDD